jgi:hypothetical protein
MVLAGILCPEELAMEAAGSPLGDTFFAVAADLAIEPVPFPFDGLFVVEVALDFGTDTKCDAPPMGRVPDGIAGPEAAMDIICNGVESKP